jgi:hypothetical protein
LLKILAAERPVCLFLRFDDGQFLQLLAGAVGVTVAVVGFGFVIVNHGATKISARELVRGWGGRVTPHVATQEITSVELRKRLAFPPAATLI